MTNSASLPPLRLSASGTINLEENAMTAMTPNARAHEGLGALASRYVDVASLPWVPTRFKGVEIKVLMEGKETGLLTALTRLAPGAVLPDHEHVELEQTYVLEGSLVDARRAWRPLATTSGVRPGAVTTPTLRRAALRFPSSSSPTSFSILPSWDRLGPQSWFVTQDRGRAHRGSSRERFQRAPPV